MIKLRAVSCCVRIALDEIKRGCHSSIAIIRGRDNLVRKEITTKIIKNSTRNYSTKLRIMNNFKLSDYNCIGFDLDNTLLRYNVTNMVRMEYEMLAKFLVEQRGYSAEYLYQPVDFKFMQKGLIVDFANGNIIRLAAGGTIQKVCHGTRMLTDQEIVQYYGAERRWEPTNIFYEDFLVTWNGPMSEKFRTLLDYFDMPASLIFGRIIDSIDNGHGSPTQYDPATKTYTVWPDVLDGIKDMFACENFKTNTHGYFAKIKQSPDKYLHRTSDAVRNWLKEIKKTKVTFLITGSFIDFANFTSTYALGENWRDLFDVVICYAKKPGFFTERRPFYAIENDKETHTIETADMKFNNVYSQGNWKDLITFLEQKCENHQPIYVGDNLLQDVYAPEKYTHCDIIVVSEEMISEATTPQQFTYEHSETIKSDVWGSYFRDERNEATLSLEIIKKHSKISVPTMDVIAQYPLDHEWECFSDKCSSGFYPQELKIT